MTDSSVGTPSANTCVKVTVTVNSALTATISPASPTINSGQSIILTASAPGGTTPYSYQWYSGSSATCSLDTNKLSTASTQSISPTSSTYYCYVVKDASTGTPAASATSATDHVTVNPALSAGAITPAAPTIDSGQTITLTANPSGGTTPYSYQWYSGSSATCSSDTTKVGTTSTLLVSPTSSTYYCYVVKDTSTGTPTASATSATDHVTVNPALSAGAITPSAPTIDSGQSITLTANPSGGTTPYSYQWYSGSSATCSSDTTTLGTASTQSIGPTSSTYYCYVVKDASTGTPAGATSGTDEVTVNPALSAGAVTPSAPTIDSGQTINLTSHVSGGSSTLSYQWYTATGSGTCTTSDSAISGATSSIYAIPSSTAAGTYYYCYIVTDTGVTSSATPVPVAGSAADTVTVNTALTAPTVTATFLTITQGQTSTLTSTTVTSGTSPYTYQWFEVAPNDTTYMIAGATLSSCSFVTTASTATGNWSFTLQVTDHTGAAVNSTAVTITVNPA